MSGIHLRHTHTHFESRQDEAGLPDIDTGASQSARLDDHGLGTKLPAGHAGGTEAAAATANDEEVGLLGNGSHDAGGGGELSREGCYSRDGRPGEMNLGGGGNTDRGMDRCRCRCSG